MAALPSSAMIADRVFLSAGNVNSSSQAQAQPHHHHLAQPSHTPTPGHSLPPPPPGNGMSSMPPPYDPLRRRSLGNAGSPPQQVGAPRGPPTTSPFAGVRDLAGSHHRPGMSISAILGGGEERRPHESPHSSHDGPAHTPKPMQPPSPGRARSYSNREGGERGYNKSSPPRPGVFGEPARIGSEPRRDGIFGSPQFRREPQHSFRAFQAPMQEHAHHLNGHGAPARPTSQPAEVERPRGMQEQREPIFDHRTGGFRSAAEHLPPRSAEPPRADLHRHERPHFPHNGITSHPQERPPFSSPQMERERSNQGPMRYPSGPGYGVHAREEQTALFRPAYPPTSHPAPEPARESIEGRAAEMRRQISRHSPPVGDLGVYDRGRNGFHERPVTLEEHQRLEAIQREQQRKESEGSMHKAILNISPELNRRGRNSPLPQAVQGAQPRHIGPGGDNPGIKMEFGRMFSGLGSGVGTTPAPSHPINGTTTPSRMSPAARHVESGDLVRSAAAEITEQRAAKSGTRLGRKSGRRSRDESDGHLGTQLYTTELSPAPAAETTADSKIKFSSKMKPIPVFAEKENCTYTVRVPRYYLSSSLARAEESYSFEEICKRRQIWGTDIYTDDSDVIAAAVHSGWIRGDFGEYNEDLNEVFGNDSDNEGPEESPLSLDAKPRRPVRVPEGFDAHITVLILPPLESYGATNRHHLWSREWKKHDGMSYMIHSIEFVDEGEMSRYAERNGAARKQRIAVEEAARREAAAGLLMFANAATSRVQVGA
ncbi:Transcriptional regulatory protein RXT3, partial [Pseudocercospora fuligena]